MARRACTPVLLAGLLALPSGALAIPGDATFGPLAPADGATLPVNPEGIPVTYTCPVYRIADPGFPLFGGPKDYGAGMSSSPALGPDGPLADATRDTGVSDPPVGPDGCSALLGAGGSPPRIQETPGTYYWQVWRLCTDCPGSYETGPVRSFILRSEVKPSLRVPRNAYAGYPFFVSGQLAGAPDGTQVAVERRRRGRWTRTGSASALGGKVEAVVVLPRGEHRLRLTVTVGSQQIVSAARRVAVRPARRWSTGSRNDGLYRGRAGSRSVRFTVSHSGRELRDFRAHVAMLCPGVTGGQLTTQTGTAALKRLRIAPDGRFVASSSPGRDTTIRVRGRLHNRRVSGGRVELSVGTCSGSAAFSAAHAVGR